MNEKTIQAQVDIWTVVQKLTDLQKQRVLGLAEGFAAMNEFKKKVN